MTNDIAFSSAMPGEEVNGLKTNAKDLLEDPRRLRLVVAVVSVEKTTQNHEKGWEKPTIKVRHIELVGDARMRAAQKLLTQELGARTGKQALPFEPGGEMTLDFDGDDEWSESQPPDIPAAPEPGELSAPDGGPWPGDDPQAG